MKNVKLIYLAAGLLAFSTPQLVRGDDTKPAPPKGDIARERFQNLSPEEREAKRKEFMEKRGEEMKKAAKDLGLDPDALQKMTPEERRAKVKEAAEKKMAELEKKKADGTITDDEKTMLGKLEMRKKMMEERPGAPGGRPRPPAEKPSDK